MLLWKAQSHQKQQQNFLIGGDSCFSDWNSVKILKEFIWNSWQIYVKFLRNSCVIFGEILEEFLRNLQGI